MIQKVSRAEFAQLLATPAAGVTAEDRDEMAFPSYMHSNPLIRWLMWRRYEVVARFSQFNSSMSVLEFGCGSGVFLPELADKCATVYATDLFPIYAQRLVDARGLSVRFIDGLAELDDGTVDLIIAADVLEHINDLQPYLKLFADKLAQNGRLIVSGPTESLLYRMGRLVAGFADKGDYHHTNIDRLTSAIGAYGFQQQALQRLPFSWMPPLFKVVEFSRPLVPFQ